MASNKPGDWALSVSELNEYVRRSLASDPMLRALRLRGELSGVKRHSSGHIYFTLKDENARIQAVMFRQRAQELDFDLRDGLKVIAEGSVSLYTAAGAYQFYAERIRPDGQGDLFARFLKLKEKLMGEGMFDTALKKPLPMRARSVGIVTSPTGAVIHDIMTVAARRDPTVRLELYPVSVQGGTAAGEIARAIRRMDARGYDVLIVGRGGGSLEDLWAFNEEVVARAIFDCATPVISAVGHEVDFTIADFVADVRAATPSVAAELAIADRAELMRLMDERSKRLARALDGLLARQDAVLARLGARMETVNPARSLALAGVRLTADMRELNRVYERYINSQLSALNGRASALERVSPAPRLAAAETALERLGAQLSAAGERGLALRRARVDGLFDRLRALSPERVLERGYAIVSVNGAAVGSVRALQPGDMLDVKMRDGSVSALAVELRDSEDVDG